MIFELGDAYPADEAERALPDAAAALALLAAERPGLLPRLHSRHAEWSQRFGASDAQRMRAIEAAIVLGVARLGLRHGRFGEDFHAYHNEGHALDLLLGRIDRLLAHPASAMLGIEDVLALELFAATHDLRQREHEPGPAPVGANEAASLCEAGRILDVCGLSAEAEPQLHLDLQLMIAGSTFEARPREAGTLDPENSAERVARGGALAPQLREWLAQSKPQALQLPGIEHALHLARIAADLDTANVGESFAHLCESAVQLASEREMRAGRRLGAAQSAEPCRQFLRHAQIRYLEELHRFCSLEGEALLGAAKARNRQRMQALAQAMDADADFSSANSGAAVITAFETLVARSANS
jgi:hypothetical protein